MIEVFLPPPLLPPFVVDGFKSAAAVKISLAIFTCVVLVFVDTFLRVLVEARNFNLATNREVTIKNTFLAIIWRGWAAVEINGKKHRFLVSGKLRADMTKKLVKSYPWLFLLSFILLTMPDVDIPILGRIDIFLSTLMYLVPIMVEIASIVENMIDLEFVESTWFKRAVDLIKQLIAFVKSIKDAIK